MPDKHLEDSQIHLGHRKRMRAKFASYGAQIFDTYEILEMLLYSVIPYKDTNPVAKRLLYAFGSLEGVFSASKDELVGVQGIGDRAAELIETVAQTPDRMLIDFESGEKAFDEISDIKQILIDHFNGVSEYKVCILYLDNSFRPIQLLDLFSDDFGASSVQEKKFIDSAIKCRASAAVIAHNHPHGPSIPSPADRATNRMIEHSLTGIGVTLIEHFVICADRAVGMMERYMHRVYQSIDLVRRPDPLHSCEKLFGEYSAASTVAFLAKLLSFVMKDSADVSQRLLSRFGGLEYVFLASIDELADEAGEGCAVYLKTVAALTTRRVTDDYKPARVYSTEQILDYLRAMYLAEPNEVVYLLSFDVHGGFIACDKVAEGTVNCSDVIPRKLLEAAAKRKAGSVIIAHNHPRGRVNPSEEDIKLTCTMSNFFSTIRIRLLDHFIISGRKVRRVDIKTLR